MTISKSIRVTLGSGPFRVALVHADDIGDDLAVARVGYRCAVPERGTKPHAVDDELAIWRCSVLWDDVRGCFTGYFERCARRTRRLPHDALADRASGACTPMPRAATVPRMQCAALATGGARATSATDFSDEMGTIQ